MIKLVLCPGWVTSKYDNDFHFVTADILACLYGVPLDKCLVRPPINDPLYLEWRGQINYLYLGPRYHGDYDLVTVLLEQST